MSRREQRPASIEAVAVPPPDPRPYVPSITLPSNREVAFLALHDSVQGHLMHWVENQHLPHCREIEWCAGCRLGQTPRWEGFVGVISLATMNRFILSIPAGAFRESGLFRDKSDARQLAGVVFTSFRFGRGTTKNRPAMIELVQPTVPTPKVKPFPLNPALARWWRMENLSVIDQVQRPEDAHQHCGDKVMSFVERLREQQRQGRRGPR